MQDRALQDRIAKTLAAGPATSAALAPALGAQEGVVLLSLWQLQTEGRVMFVDDSWSLKEDFRSKFFTKPAG